MEPVRYPQGRNMSGGCGQNRNNQIACSPRQNQMPMNDNRTAGMPCRNRFMDNGGDFPVGMAYVPWQTWGDLYSPEQGLCEGTIFEELNQIFCGKRGNRA
ncbi:MAG: spore coat associated protein CotJA [Clostridium sp.]|nr:spore coat associated protein CotJA [Clostridium sp.]